jgi:starch-binding outer membrane protein, SusD/RagB family
MRTFAKVLLLAIRVTAAALSSACSTERLLEADQPDYISPGSVNNLQGATALYAGALGDFAVAHDGGNGAGVGMGLVIATGFVSDEFRFGGTTLDVREMDLRAVRETNSAWAQTYLDQHRAREAAERAALALLEVVPAKDARIGEMYAIVAAEVILLGEAYCSGAPLGTTIPTLSYGEPQTTQQLMQTAIAKLAVAAQHVGADDARIANLIAVLRGRALLNVARYAEAAAAVSNVPTSFGYGTLHSKNTERQKLLAHSYMYYLDSWLVSDREGGNGLNFATASDPRVPIDGPGTPSRVDQRTPRYYYKKYNTSDASVTVASGVEARLIEAEAALQTGNTALWLTKLNEARAPYSMPPVVDPDVASARVDLTFRERAFALFGTAHRAGDLRRMIRQYGRSPESVFPTGAYHKDNMMRGTDVNIAIPSTERSNPKFNGCLGRGA